MHFKIAKSAQSYFNNIMNLEGSHAAEDKNKFIQFDVYYCCALIGMAAGQGPVKIYAQNCLQAPAE